MSGLPSDKKILQHYENYEEGRKKSLQTSFHTLCDTKTKFPKYCTTFGNVRDMARRIMRKNDVELLTEVVGEAQLHGGTGTPITVVAFAIMMASFLAYGPKQFSQTVRGEGPMAAPKQTVVVQRGDTTGRLWSTERTMWAALGEKSKKRLCDIATRFAFSVEVLGAPTRLVQILRRSKTMSHLTGPSGQGDSVMRPDMETIEMITDLYGYYAESSGASVYDEKGKRYHDALCRVAAELAEDLRDDKARITPLIVREEAEKLQQRPESSVPPIEEGCLRVPRSNRTVTTSLHLDFGMKAIRLTATGEKPGTKKRVSARTGQLEPLFQNPRDEIRSNLGELDGRSGEVFFLSLSKLLGTVTRS